MAVDYINCAQRDAPDPSRCLGVFNLSMYTTEKDLREMFNEFGEIEKVGIFLLTNLSAKCLFINNCPSQIDLIYDHPTGRSRGFGFIYFERLDDASAARDKLNGIEVTFSQSTNRCSTRNLPPSERRQGEVVRTSEGEERKNESEGNEV